MTIYGQYQSVFHTERHTAERYWKLCLYAKNGEKLQAMLSEQQAEQYEKMIDAFNEVTAQSELKAFEFGFTLAARLMIDVIQTMELPSIDDA